MSYFPDWRHETGKLNERDRAYIQGWRNGVEDLLNIFNNLDVYEVTEDEEELLQKFKECCEEWAECNEVMCVVSLFDNANYLGDDVDLVDANPPLYQCASDVSEREAPSS